MEWTYIVGALVGSLNFALGFYLGRTISRADRTESRVISPTRHAAPALQRRADRIAKQDAISASRSDTLRVISPSKKRSASMDMDTI